MPERRDPLIPAPAPWVREEADDVEPDWAQSIRDRRKARGDRLREVFATFEALETGDDPASVIPTRPESVQGGAAEPEEGK